jgi:rhodanese-related sulfurtransferase
VAPAGHAAAAAAAAGDLPLDLAPRELAERLARGEELVLVDVREPMEWRIARLPGATLVLYCHHGVRSLQALEHLRRAGFTRLRNLSGGIDAWSREVDPSVPRY